MAGQLIYPAFIAIGFWWSEREPDLPDPAWFVDPDWDPAIRRRIIWHLQDSFRMPNEWMGYSWCRFRCETAEQDLTLLSTGEYTNGTFIWPEALLHYIQHHHVRLPDEVISHMLAHPPYLYRPLNQAPEYHLEWWKHQRGWQLGAESFYSPVDIGFLTIQQTDPGQVPAQIELLKRFLAGIRGRLHTIDRIIAGERVTINDHLKDYVNPFMHKASKVGLVVSFRRMTVTEAAAWHKERTGET